jgi:hypothetical protein
VRCRFVVDFMNSISNDALKDVATIYYFFSSKLEILLIKVGVPRCEAVVTTLYSVL